MDLAGFLMKKYRNEPFLKTETRVPKFIAAHAHTCGLQVWFVVLTPDGSTGTSPFLRLK